MKIMSLALSLMVGPLALAQAPMSSPLRSSGEIETSCRVKAKEVAAQTYRSCVTDQKNAQIEHIKKEYQAKLQALKAHYEAELKKMNAVKSKAALDPAANSEAGTPSEAPSASAAAAPEAAAERNESDSTSVTSPTTATSTESSTVTSEEAAQPTATAPQVEAPAAPVAAPPVKKTNPPAANKKTPAKAITEKKAKSPVSSPAKKMIVKKSAPSGTKTAKLESGPTEMTVRLKPAPVTPKADESTMDLPEPIPVENVSGGSI